MSDAKDAPVQNAGDAVVIVPCFAACPPPTLFTFFTERYYSQFLIRNCRNVEGNNVRLFLHSNNLCVLCLDPSHRVVRERLVIKELLHSVRRGTNFVDREPIVAQGKRKKNAMRCEANTVLCFLVVESGSEQQQANSGGTSETAAKTTIEFRVPACINGTVLEINSLLTKRPQLIQDAPLTEGYIAIINPHQKTTFDGFEKISTATSGEFAADAGD